MTKSNPHKLYYGVVQFRLLVLVNRLKVIYMNTNTNDRRGRKIKSSSCSCFVEQRLIKMPDTWNYIKEATKVNIFKSRSKEN